MAEKAWLRFNGRFDAEIEAMAKVSVAELRPKSCAAHQLPTIQSASIVIFAPLPAVRRGDDRGLRCAPASPSQQLTQTEQPRSSPSFQEPSPAERATARHAKLTRRWELATACMRPRRAPEVRPPPPPSKRRRPRRVYPGEPPATVAVPLDHAALGQSAEPHRNGTLVAAGCLRPLHDASLRFVAHSL